MAQEQKKDQKKDDFRYIVRIANTDLDGNKSVGFGMKKIKGVGYSISIAACKIAGISPSAKAGYLTEAQAGKLGEIVSGISKYGYQRWMMNRRKDPESGEDIHLLGGDLQFTKENDIKMMKKIKCYRGTRHMSNLPSRGQRTKSNFRRTKSRGKGAIGVKKKSAPGKK